MTWRVKLRDALLAGTVAATAFTVFASQASEAATPPFAASEVSLTAREQPIGEFLKALFSQAGLTVVLSPELSGQVSGVFKGPASKVYGGVARAFNLLTYYDGVAVYVYPSTQISSRAVDVRPAESPRLQAAVRQLGLPDAQNQVRVSNRMLVATGSKRFLDQVDELAKTSLPAGAGGAGGQAYVATATAAAAPALQYRVYYLRYAWAEDVTLTFSGRQVTLPGVATILRSLINGGSGGGAAQRTDAPPAGMLSGLRGQGLNPNGGRDLGTLGFNLAAFGNMPPAQNSDAWANVANNQAVGAALQAAGGAAAAAEQPRVVADNRLNAVIIRDTREHLAAYDQLVRALDVEPQLVQIDATVIDIDTDKVRELGAGINLSDFTGDQQFNLGVGSGGNFSQSPNGTIGAGNGGVLDTQLSAGPIKLRVGIQALIQKNAAKIVARPEVVTLSDVEAVFDNSRTFYVRVSGYASSDLYNINAGTTLRVTPHVMRDNGETRVRLLIAIQDGTLTGQTVDKIPVVQNSGINTQALLAEGQSVLLGGLVTDADTKTIDKVPLFGDIPGLGFFFRSSSKEYAHTERLFLITPRLVSVGAANGLPPGSHAPMAYAPQAAPAGAPTPPPPPPKTPPTATTKPTQP